MNKFTFVTLSYNHENFIVEHLESIKAIVNKYGDNIEITYILSDDCSKDTTVETVTKWLKKNPIFHIVKLYSNEKNIGIVNNFIKAISLVETENFKLLAGDDVYGLIDIFKVFEMFDKALYVTPVTPFGDCNAKTQKRYEYQYRLLMYMEKQGKAADLLRYKNFISAPGVFYKRSLLRDEKLIDFIQQFMVIEDYPLWFYLLNIKKVDLIVDNCSYIYYRTGVGITTGPTKELKEKFTNDLTKIKKIISPKLWHLPKYINPHMYYLGFLYLKANIQKEKFPVVFLPNRF